MTHFSHSRSKKAKERCHTLHQPRGVAITLRMRTTILLWLGKFIIWKKCYMHCGVWNQMKIWSSHLLDNLSNLSNLSNGISNPVESPEFFRFMRQLLKLSSKCEDHIFIWFKVHNVTGLKLLSIIWSFYTLGCLPTRRQNRFMMTPIRQINALALASAGLWLSSIYNKTAPLFHEEK